VELSVEEEGSVAARLWDSADAIVAAVSRTLR